MSKELEEFNCKLGIDLSYLLKHIDKTKMSELEAEAVIEKMKQNNDQWLRG